MSNFAMERFIRVRQRTMELIKPLTPEDMILQAMTDVSPTKWHLAHTTWFFETFILLPKKNYRPFHDDFQYLFNSYYEGVGPYFPRAQRGLLSRPLLSEIMDYRAYVDEAILQLCSDHERDLLILGSHHEEQHQELLLTDILYNFSINRWHRFTVCRLSSRKKKLLPCRGLPMKATWLPSARKAIIFLLTMKNLATTFCYTPIRLPIGL